MVDSEVAHSASPDLAFHDGIFHRSPAFQSLQLATIRAMQQIKIYVRKAAPLDGCADGFACSAVRGIRLELRGEEKVFPFQAILIVWA